MMAKTLTIRLDDSQSERLDSELSRDPVYKTASKLFWFRFTAYAHNAELIGLQEREIEELQLEVDRLKSILEDAGSAAKALIEKVGQDDLF